MITNKIGIFTGGSRGLGRNAGINLGWSCFDFLLHDKPGELRGQ